MDKHTKVVLISLLVAACGAPTTDEERSLAFTAARIDQSLTNENTILLNGRTLNGKTLNGSDLTSVLVNIDTANVLVNGQVVPKVTLAGTSFIGAANGVTYQGPDFVGAEFAGNVGDGGILRVRISQMQKGSGPNADLDLYMVEYQDLSTLAWHPVCTDAIGSAVPALPVRGYWNYQMGTIGGGNYYSDDDSFTFACTSGAIGKCVLWGYRPWATLNGVPLQPYHQACTRLVRADYCGDGMSYTSNGAYVNLYDDLTLQVDTEEWQLEALWAPSGAYCFRSYNRSAVQVPCHRTSLQHACDSRSLQDPKVLLASEIL